MTGTIQSLNLDFSTGKPSVTLALNEKNEAVRVYEELKDCEKLSIEMKPFREKRSLDANAYFWVLADKLAEKLNSTKEEVYKNYIKDIGGNSGIVCVEDKAVDKLCEVWESRGIGYQTDVFPSKLKGCTNVVLYYGSSTYDTKQMSRLIDSVVEDCKEQGIETKTPDEIENLKSLWKGE